MTTVPLGELLRARTHTPGGAGRITLHDRHHCAQNADHLAHSHPFSPVFAEVVCTLAATPPQTVISPPPNGGMASLEPRHDGDPAGADGRSGRHRHHRQPNFARDLSRSFFEMPQKRCNSNDANSMFESVVEELRAELLVDSHSWASGQRTEPTRRGSRAAHGAARPQGRARLPENPRVHKQQPAPHSNT